MIDRGWPAWPTPSKRVHALVVAIAVGTLSQALVGQQPVSPDTRAIVATRHEPLPAQPSAYWLSPAASSSVSPAMRDFARAVDMIEQGGDIAGAAPLLAVPGLEASTLGTHVRYYRGVVAQRQFRLDEALALFTPLAASAPRSFVVDEAQVRLAEVHELRGQFAAAAEAYGRAVSLGSAEPDRLLHRWAVALERAGDAAASVKAHRRVYYEYPLSVDADESGAALRRLAAQAPPFDNAPAKERARADVLYANRRWAMARDAYLRVVASTSGPERDHATVRIAASDVQLKQYRAAVDRLRQVGAAGPLQAEVGLHLALASRGQGDVDGYEQGVRQLAAKHPESAYAEEALNGLATWYLQRDQDAAAAAVFAQMVTQFPAGRFAERAAWKAGWWAYRHDDPAGAVTAFETGAANFPRSDFRPSWLYWSARAKERLGDSAGAAARLTLTATDYYNSYYGRLALSRLGAAASGVPRSVVASPAPRTAPPTQSQIGLLLALGLNDLALSEAQFARRVFGDSPGLMATIALAHHRAGRLRPAINAMKRAYPQYLASGGESLPAEVMRVLFPLDHWPLLEAGAKTHGLDPYLVAALAAQESTFDAGIRSSAGAIGLMQIMPATGLGFARRMGIKSFSARRLTDPSVNASIGTRYLSDLMKQFGAAAYALAGYNAGEHRVVRWRAASPGLAVDEWVEDIPFPETQNYVKRILGTAEDYRRLYGGGVLTPGLDTVAAPAVPARPGPKAVRPPAKTAPSTRKAPAPTRRTPVRPRPGATP